MALSAFKKELLRIANSEFDRFSEFQESDDPLRQRIDQYCRDIGLEPPDDITEYPWSAVFISWCVKSAGATEDEFKFDDTHAVYVKAAIANADAETGNFRARRIDDYSPKLGDIVQANRESGRVTYNQARTRRSYPSHCAIVVDLTEQNGRRFATTIGGNESDSVRRTKVPLTQSGHVQQRSSNPYICVIETLKSDIAMGAGPTAFAAAAESYVCAGSGEDESLAQMAATAAGHSKPPVDRTITSPNKSNRGGTDIDHIVVHYTTSRNIEGTISHFKNPGSQVSAHYIIGQDGELVQMVPDSQKAWHAGGTTGMNSRSIGIEHVARAGDKITPAQEKTSIALIRWLMKEYSIPAANVIPHVCVRDTDCCGDLFLDYGGGRGKPCGPQKAAVQAWLQALTAAPGHAAAFATGPADIPSFSIEAAGAIEAARAALAVSPRTKMAQAIVDFEARRDAQGRLKVYYLPAGDGGGRYEVAGINERYHKQVCDELVELIESGRQAEAERRAVEYVAAYTDKVAEWTSVKSVESYLRDSMFNRGMGGAAWMIQKAVGVDTDRRVGPQTLAAIAQAEGQPRQLLEKLRASRERYEKEVIGRNEGSIFWRGLVNRWNKAFEVALGF